MSGIREYPPLEPPHLFTKRVKRVFSVAPEITGKLSFAQIAVKNSNVVLIRASAVEAAG